MEKKEKTMASKEANITGDNNRSNMYDDEVLNLDELFDVQGGVNTDDEQEYTEHPCGLGCYGRNIAIKNDNEK